MADNQVTPAAGSSAVHVAAAAPSPPPPASPDTEHVPRRERAAYAVGDVGANLVFATAGTFLLFYLTDIAGVGAAIAGTLLLFGRVLDGTLDLVVGTLIDKTSTRWGKARPWIFFSTPVLVVSFVLLFTVPAGLGDTAKQAYVFLMYVLCLGVGFVCSNLAYHTLLSVITSSARVRVSLTVLRTFAAIFTTLVVNVVTIPVITSLGGGQSAWTTVATTYAVIAAATFLVLFFGTRERVRPAAVTLDEATAIPLRTKLRVLLHDRYFFVILGAFLLFYLLQGSAGISVYYAADVLGDPNLQGVLGLVQIAPLLIGLWFMPALATRFGKRPLILVGMAVAALGSAISLIDPSSLTLVAVGGVVRGIGTLPMAAVLFALVADVIDHGEWKSGLRLDGMNFAAATAGQNFGAGLGIAMVGWLLAAGGYDGQAETQTASAVSMEIFLQLGLPIIVFAALGILMWFFDLDAKLPRVQRELAERRAAHTDTE